MRLILTFASFGAMRRLAFGSLVALGLVATAGRNSHALTINATFGSSITNDANSVAIEAAINNAISVFTALIADPFSVNILFQTGATSLGQSSYGVFQGSYSAVRSLLSADSTANPSNTVLSTAVANLANTTNAPNGLSNVDLTAAAGRALGVGLPYCFTLTGTFGCGAGGAVIDGIITLSDTAGRIDYTRPIASGQYDGLRVIEHEIDEVLGIGGPGSTLGTGLQGTASGLTDLYRYTSPSAGVYNNSYTTVNSAAAYFSVNGGATKIVDANQSGAGADYGDFKSVNCPAFVQDASSCPDQTADITRTSPEAILLQAIGYELTAATPVPEAGTLTVLGLALTTLRAIRRRRKV